MTEPDRLIPYIPSVALDWEIEAAGALHRSIRGTLVFVDISGFTNLSERLARRGRIGAEELTTVLNRVFGEMLDAAFARGGSLIKFGGDALLLLFQGDDHVVQACAATVEMSSALRDAVKVPTSVGRIQLKMSSGIHTGEVDFFLVGDSHREVIVTGPAASWTTAMETTAEAGEIVVSPAVKELLPYGFIGEARGNGWLLRRRRFDDGPAGVIGVPHSGAEAISQLVSAGLRDYLGTGIEEPEHRIATVGFVKFSGLDTLLSVHGPDQVASHLDTLIRSVQKAVDDEGITFLATDIDTDGGKVILTAGVPSSQPDDEGRMLRSLRAVLDSDTTFSVKAGINRGHVFAGAVGTVARRTYTVMGDTVNLAARLMAAAGPRMVYSTPGALDSSSTLFRTEALEPFKVKGKEQEIHAYAVFEETGVRPPDLGYDLPFHGREAERDLIVQIITTCARTGRGGMMTITGDTGIGKTRLIAEVLEECPGLDTLMVQAEPTGADNPYWAFRDPTRRMLGIERGSQSDMAKHLNRVITKRAPQLAWAMPLLGDVLHMSVPDTEETKAIDPQFRPERTADVMIELLAALFTGPFAAIGEDGQWMDEASISLLRRIGEAAKDHPWTVIFTARKEQTDFEPLGDEITLRPLGDTAVRAIVNETTAAAPLRPHELDAVVNRVGGNPMFLSSILDIFRETGSAEQLPDSLDAVVSTEIDTLPPLTRQILRYASVLGRSFRRVVLDEFLAPEAIELDDATRDELSRFIEADGSDRIRFRHSVVHDVAYEGLSYRRRKDLHARAGDVIERLAGDDTAASAGFLAYHYSESGNYEKAWLYSRMAADRARDAYANAEAATQYRRALEAARWIDIDPAETAEVQEQLGDVFDRLGNFGDALTSYRRAQRSYRDPQAQARVLFVQGTMLQRMGEYVRALSTLTRGLKIANSHGASDVAVDILAQKAWTRHYQGRHREATSLAKEALQLAGNEASLGVVLAEMAADLAAHALGKRQDHSATWRAYHMAEKLGALHTQGTALLNLGLFAYYEGRWDEAADLYARSSEAYRKTGDAIAAAYGEANVAEILLAQGHLSEAEATFSRVLPVVRAAGDLYVEGFVLGQMGQVELRRGDIEAGLRHFDQAIDIYDSMGARTERVDVMLRRAEGLVFTGVTEKARDLVSQHGELQTEQLPAQLRPLAHRVQGLIAWADGDAQTGLQHLETALDAARSLGSELDELTTIHALAATGIVEPQLTDRAAALCTKLGIVSVPIVRRLEPVLSSGSPQIRGR